MSRRSVRKKDEVGSLKDEAITPRVTRRQSTTNALPSATIGTPRSTAYIKRRLNENDIEKELEDENDEFNHLENTKKSIGKDQNNIYKIKLKLDEDKICMQFTKVSNKESYDIDYPIGKKKNEKTFNQDNITTTSEKLTRSRKSIHQSNNETAFGNSNVTSRTRSETPRAAKNSVHNGKDKIIDKKNQNNLRSTSLTTRKNKESPKTKDDKDIVKRKTRKRSEASENKHQSSDKDSENEVDENKMQNANTSALPSHLRSKTPSRTPRKSTNSTTPVKRSAKHLKDSVDTPKKIPRTPSKISLNTPMKALSLDDQEKNSKFRGTPKRLYQKSANKTPEQINKFDRRRSTKQINYNENKDDSMFEEVDESDEYNIDAEEEDDESTSESEGISESDTDEIYSLSQKPKYIKSAKKANSKNVVKDHLKTPSKTPKKISMETPTKAFSRLSIKNNLTPSMHQRTANVVKPSTPLQEARAKLHVSVLPKSLPCREEQFNDIYTFLHARLSDSSGGCIYISGVPGTGKTATVNEVIRCLKKLMKTRELPEFDFIDVNGMKLSEPRQAYVQILKQLTGQSTTWEEAHKLLHDRFTKSNSKRGMTLLLVDELDLLCTKRQDVVYNLLDWPSKTGAKLVVVTIANTMDLPERILMGKVTSRLGLTRLTFPPYNHKQLEEIVVSRLKGHNAFKNETVQLVARKVAAVSGDARRALDICRRATEIAEANDREIVTMIDVKQALDEMIASPKIQAIRHCSDMEKAFLQAVCSEVNRTGVEEVVFYNVYFQLNTVCTFNGQKVPNITEALSICARLGSWRLLLCDHSRMDIHQRLLLNVSTDDVHFATQSIED